MNGYKIPLTLAALALFGCPIVPPLQFIHEGGIIGTETWREGIHEVQDSIRVQGVLTVEPCSTIHMASGATINVDEGGSLRWIGTEECPIIVTSAEPSPSPGDWTGIELYATASSNNELRFVEISFAGRGYGAIWIEDGAELSMRDSIIRDSADFGLTLEDGAVLQNFVGNKLINNEQGAIRLTPDGVAALGAGTYTPNGVEGIRIIGVHVTKDATWEDLGTPYVLEDGLNIEAAGVSARLTVQAGTTIKLTPDGQISVGDGGGLSLLGTAAKPVRVTSSKPVPDVGDWWHIEIFEGSQDAANIFENAIIEYGGGAGYGSVWIGDGASVKITDTIIRRSSDFGIEAINGAELRNFTGNSLIENVAGSIKIGAPELRMLGPGTYQPNGEEPIWVNYGTLDQTATWLNLGVPLYLPGGFSIGDQDTSVLLTLAAGNRLWLGPNAQINVASGSGLSANGTAAQHVKITSSSVIPSPGDWGEIDFYGNSTGIFTYTDISYGGSAGYGQIWLDDESQITLDHAIFTQGAGCDIDGTGSIDATASSYVLCN